MFQENNCPVVKVQIQKVEKEIKEKALGIALAEEARKSLEAGKSITGMAGQELNILLKWFNETDTIQGRVDERRGHWKNIGQ